MSCLENLRRVCVLAKNPWIKLLKHKTFDLNRKLYNAFIHSG